MREYMPYTDLRSVEMHGCHDANLVSTNVEYKNGTYSIDTAEGCLEVGEIAVSAAFHQSVPQVQCTRALRQAVLSHDDFGVSDDMHMTL
jgi:hypothetical protein